MTLRSLQAVLRSLADATPAADDGELLRRFVNGEEGAFAELVRRHGRLVWTVCRHLTGSDSEADDAFQATFVVLLRSAGKVRNAARLSAWLHGVAYKVCARARQAAKLRTAREQAAASRERNSSVVADSAWDRALAAVHEEVGRLPEALRVPFVLCCLEGKGLTEAAGQLGWKLGTFSSRLTRAKSALLARLDARGLTLGAVAGLGLAAPPGAAVAKATALARVGFAVPNSVLELTHGVIGMNMTSFKVLAAAVLVACGLGVDAGSQWISTAEAQTPNKRGQATGQSKINPDDDLKRRALEARRLAEELEEALRAEDKQQDAAELLTQARKQEEAEKTYLRALAEAQLQLAVEANRKPESASAKSTRWEYDFVAVSDMDQEKFMKFLQDRENRGWDFAGTTQLRQDGKPTDIWVFRRPARGSATAKPAGPSNAYTPRGAFFDRYTGGMSAQNTSSSMGQPGSGGSKAGPSASLPMPAVTEKSGDAKAIEAEIVKLQDQLAKLKRKPVPYSVMFSKDELPLEPAALAEVLLSLAGKKFKNAHYTFTPTTTGIALDGDKDVIEWAVVMIKKLADK